MEQESSQAIVKGDASLKVAGVALIAGAVVTVIGFLVHPFIQDITDMEDVRKAW
jgi:uncharacterized phosphosugar-binding protein